MAGLAVGAALLGSAPGGAIHEPSVRAQRDAGVVARIVGGDTFYCYCRDGRKVRLLGMDSPERWQGDA